MAFVGSRSRTGNDAHEVEFIHDRAVFRREFCDGKDERFVLAVLKARGYIRSQPKRNTLAVALPGMGGRLSQCIVVKAAILSDDKPD